MGAAVAMSLFTESESDEDKQIVALRTMSQLSVAFAIIVKNGAEELPFTIRNIEEAGKLHLRYTSSLLMRAAVLAKLFKEYVVIVYENDSNDDTVKLLRNWERNSEGKVLVLSETGVNVKGSWLNAVARARNKYMEVPRRMNCIDAHIRVRTRVLPP
jgi:hypothetical protein